MTAIGIEELSDPSFDPALADDLLFGDTDDPYRLLAELREREGPVVEVSLRDVIAMPMKPSEGYEREFTVLSYRGVDQILNDTQTFVSEPMRQVLANFGPLLTGMDAPEHTYYRRMFQRLVRPASVQAWGQDVVQPVVDTRIEGIVRSGRAELVAEYARPFPFEVICRLLALPAADLTTFYRLTTAQIGSPFAAEASQKLGRYFARLLADRRNSGAEDLISVIAGLLEGGDPLPHDVAISFLLQLMSAGGETTFRTTTVVLFALLTDREQFDLVRDNRDLVPLAVEEALRWDGPVIRGTRATTRDVEVEGVVIPEHSVVHVAYGAANRDPDVFVDPDRFDVRRERHRHFGFAFGAHNCLGQQIARLEIACALEAFLDRLHGVRLDPTYPKPHLRGANMRTPRELHVVFDV